MYHFPCTSLYEKAMQTHTGKIQQIFFCVEFGYQLAFLWLLALSGGYGTMHGKTEAGEGSLSDIFQHQHDIPYILISFVKTTEQGKFWILILKVMKVSSNSQPWVHTHMNFPIALTCADSHAKNFFAVCLQDTVDQYLLINSEAFNPIDASHLRSKQEQSCTHFGALPKCKE